MNRWRVGEDRGSKETDGCPLTLMRVLIVANDVDTEWDDNCPRLVETLARRRSGRSGRHIMMWRQLVGRLTLLIVGVILLLQVLSMRVGLVLWWTNVVGFGLLCPRWCRLAQMVGLTF
jgi:hypothetical protein